MYTKPLYLIGDFETTVYDNQKDTEVWASAVSEMGTENVKIFKSIEETYDYLLSLDRNIVIYYHNLKFDGMFWVSFILYKTNLKLAATEREDGSLNIEWIDDKYMKNGTYKYMISQLGQWYDIVIKINGHFIKICDSLKLLPFSVKSIGKGFDTKHKKLDMEYKGLRYSGCEITKEEQDYIANDVLVVNEAMTILKSEGHTATTIGGCCLKDFHKRYSLGFNLEWDKAFPNLYEIELDKDLYGSVNAGEYIRKSYRGGWCYVVPGKSKRIVKNGCTLDVNSLYPSVMSGESGNKYPIGLPHFWKGEMPLEARWPNHFYFIRIRTRFKLKPGKLPFIQIKTNLNYRGNENLITSDIFDEKTGKYHSHFINMLGEVEEAKVILTLTNMDYELIKEHYDLTSCEILDGCWFDTDIGFFDDYINHYKDIKMNSSGAKRQLAKLFLNNLYGKYAANTNSSFKVAYKKDDGTVGFYTVIEYNKKPGYIPIGSAITSYARCFTIRAAQLNYYGANRKGFIYADTDSIHCDLDKSKIRGVKLDDKNFLCWKVESEWDFAYFTRQKTYIEHIKTDNGYKYDIKCAGMPEKAKQLFARSLEDYELSDEEKDSYTQEEIEFVSQHRTLNDFDIGLKIPGKLIQRQLPGGVVLAETPYEMRSK